MKGGTYHNTVNLVGNFPDLEARKSRIRIRIRKAVLGIRGSGSVPKYNTGSKMWSGTYHNSTTLVGYVPDLEARKEQDTDPEGSVRNPRIRICTKRIHNISVADPGCLYRIPDPQHWKYDVEGEPTTTPRPLLGMSLISRPKKSMIQIRFRKAVLGIHGSGSVPNYNTGSKMWSGT